MEFSEKLKMLRMQANLTQSELADKLFVSRQARSNYEKGRGYPSIDTLVSMSKLFYISLDELLSSGARRRNMKYIIILITLLFLLHIVSLLSIYALIQRAIFTIFSIVFIIATSIIPFMCLVISIIFQYNPPKTINKIFGYRTKLSMKNQLTWDFAQAYFSLVLAKITIFLFFLCVICSILFMFVDLNVCYIIGCVLFCIQAFCLILPICFVERKIKRLFKSRVLDK